MTIKCAYIIRCLHFLFQFNCCIEILRRTITAPDSLSSVLDFEVLKAGRLPIAKTYEDSGMLCVLYLFSQAKGKSSWLRVHK